MYNPMMNPRAGQERLKEMIAEADAERRARKNSKGRNLVKRVRALLVKTVSTVIR